ERRHSTARTAGSHRTPRIISCATLIAIGSVCGFAQQDLSLDQAITAAIEHNRRIDISKSEVDKAKNSIEVSRTYRLPQFKFLTMEGQMLVPLTFTFPAGSFGSFPGIGPFPPATSPVTSARRPFNITQAGMAQPLSQQFRIGLGIQASKLNQKIAEEKLRLEQQNIVNDVKKTYYNMLQTQSALRATDTALTLFKELDRVATNALAEQAILKSDVLDARAGIAKVESDRSGLQNTFDTLKEKMNNLLGRGLDTQFTVSAELEAKPWEYDLATTRARALDQRPELKEAKLKVELAETDRRAKRAEYIPDVSFRFDYLSFRNLDVLPKNVTAASFILEWDVFDWGRKKQELLSKSSTIKQATTAVDETASQIQVEVGLHFRKLDAARAQLKAANLALEADQEKVRIALNRYEEKTILLKDLLQLRASVAEKTYKYQETLMAFWNARADLEKSTGER
ncbi:MAG: TolC family protein, partial [Chloroflexia bacterium]